MSFGLDKCAILEMRRGRQVGSSGIDLPDNQHIKEVEEDGYKYLGIMQLDKILNTEMKGKITSEYVRRVKKLCRSKLNGGNLISGINTWAVSFYVTVQVLWIGQWKSWSAWIEELGKFLR